MKTIRGRAVRALFGLCLAGVFALSCAVSPCFAVNNDYYWSTGSGSNHLWGDDQGGWWKVTYEVDRGGADHPNPSGHYEWKKENFLNSLGPIHSTAYFSAFNQTVQPKVFSVSLDGSNKVSLSTMQIDNTRDIFNTGHDWTFTGDYLSEGKENIYANQIVIKGGASNSRFTTTFSDLYVTTGSLHIYDYNTLLVKDGSRLWASEVVLDSGVLDIRGGTLTFGPITGKNNSSVKITAHGTSANISPLLIFTTSVLFTDTYGTSPGNDHSLFADFFDSNITIGDAQSRSWVEFLGTAFSSSIKLNITQGSRLSFAGDNSFDSYFTPFLELSGSGTLRLT
ncbi:MAG: hypothetical protein LBR82_09395, partial [Desulfovibrio sp.]|nr:hypothetical protein [Desulfovibrio sp.]